MAEQVTLSVNGTQVSVAVGSMVSAAISAVGETAFRTSVRGEPRGPLCGMGICFECRVSVDGVRHVRACQRLCQPGMQVSTHD
jgi:sarcosine oxidase subunit alpha